MASLRIPVATYRLQFNQDFTFRDARDLLGYLQDLGITDIYASPLLQSRRGSGHGYDVTDPTRLDTDAGSHEEFEAFQAELQRRGMGLILDIVPNHMAASSENPWWMDLLENGPGSAYASHFDIDWHPPYRSLENKVLLPVLADLYGRVLENRELQPVYRDGSFRVQYRQETFPLSPASYRRILKHRLDVLEKRLGSDSSSCQEYRGILASLAALPAEVSLPIEAAGERRLQTQAVKERLQRLQSTVPDVRRFISENLRLFSGIKNRPSSFRLLDRALSEQAYVLSFWQNPNAGINYRRFFAIVDLVGVRVEDPLVFEATHSLIFRLVEQGFVRGLRIDHIDGLRDPLGYLQRLQERLAGSPGGEPRSFYLIVEKILSGSERLPPEWPVFGTTGYDFLNAVNRLFIEPRGARAVERIYARFVGSEVDYEEILYRKKKLVINTLLAVEVRSLSRQLGLLAEQDRYARDLPFSDLAQALAEITVCLTVYRTYVRNLALSGEARTRIEAAVREARRRRPNLSPACFDFVREVLLIEDAGHLLPEQREARLSFVMRWQQFTGPVMAKGQEDTALYVYNPLVALNEVGGDPRPGKVLADDFHQFVKDRARAWPNSLNATATHDTKRGEDVRARISVLSGNPAEWARRLRRWSRLNASRKKFVNGQIVPDSNDEILFYQTLIGAWPASPAEILGLKERLQAYLIKAMREAMVHTRWTQPNLAQEGALVEFIDSVLSGSEDDPFLNDFHDFYRKVAYWGMLNGLAQVLLKIVCPGVPDFYQGCELWDLHLVDPDNRGRVDFALRTELLRSIQEQANGAPAPAFLDSLLQHWTDGRVKLYLTWRALNFRGKHPQLFLEGDYAAVEARGNHNRNVVALVRSFGDEHLLAALPRWLASAKAPMKPGQIQRFWAGGELVLPARAPRNWFNVLTGQRLICSASRRPPTLALREVFQIFPVALLFAAPGDRASEESRAANGE